MSKSPILIVDDNQDDYVMISRHIRSEYQTLYNNGSDDVIELVHKHHPECLIIDYHLTTHKGIDLLKQVKSNKTTADKPVIMLTGETNPEVIINCMKCDAADYIIKGQYNSELLKNTISKAIEKAKLQHKIKQQQRQIIELSRIDELTGAYLRRYFIERVNNEISRCRRSETTFSIALVDLDNFKMINDHYGHPVGDAVLQESTRIIKESTRASDYVGRYGGDEFIVLLLEPVVRPLAKTCEFHVQKYNEIRQKIRDCQIQAEDEVIHFTATFGVAVYDRSDSDFSTLLTKADQALYQAKENGRDCLAYYNQGETVLIA